MFQYLVGSRAEQGKQMVGFSKIYVRAVSRLESVNSSPDSRAFDCWTVVYCIVFFQVIENECQLSRST